MPGDAFARQSAQPLPPKQQAQFQGLQHFSENPALRFEIPLDLDGERIPRPASDHDRTYRLTSGVTGEEWTATGTDCMAVGLVREMRPGTSDIILVDPL